MRKIPGVLFNNSWQNNLVLHQYVFSDVNLLLHHYQKGYKKNSPIGYSIEIKKTKKIMSTGLAA